MEMIVSYYIIMKYLPGVFRCECTRLIVVLKGNHECRKADVIGLAVVHTP